MRGKVVKEINRLFAEGILKPKEYSEWAATAVAVHKSDQKLKCDTMWEFLNDGDPCCLITLASYSKSRRYICNLTRRQKVHKA